MWPNGDLVGSAGNGATKANAFAIQAGERARNLAGERARKLGRFEQRNCHTPATFPRTCLKNAENNVEPTG